MHAHSVPLADLVPVTKVPFRRGLGPWSGYRAHGTAATGCGPWTQGRSGPRLVTFFAVMYYAGLRPEEAIDLTADNVILPPPGRPDDEDWGELHIRSATPDAGSEWTDDGSPRERRQLKHRAEGDSRIVPTHPELTRLLRDHLEKFGTAPDGRLFSGVRGGELPTITYWRAWIKARQVALTAAEQASPLARRPYDLRHACPIHVAQRRRLSHPGS
jgi:integrase